MSFPGTVTEILHLVVVRDVEASKVFYVDLLGATVVCEMPGVLAFLDLGGARLVLSTAGDPTEDKPTVVFTSPTDPDSASAELILRVADTRATYEALRARGVEFLTPPVDFGWEIRCYVRDPDGHLIEITQPGADLP